LLLIKHNYECFVVFVKNKKDVFIRLIPFTLALWLVSFTIHLMIHQHSPAVPHKFHIPVMGLGFTIDTPLKVAHWGISSAISVMEDNLIEKMRRHYATLYQLPYTEIPATAYDARANRIQAYLELIQNISDFKYKSGIAAINGTTDFEQNYIELAPNGGELQHLYEAFKQNPADEFNKEALINAMPKGRIEVNIMTRIDKPAYDSKGKMLAPEFSDAKSALRGVGLTTATVSVVFSAGFNPALYAYCENFADFFPDENGRIKKEIILKVSDYRSARIQGLFLAKKGIWVSEFRIESGLNCGGHAFVSEGTLMGPVMETFRTNRQTLADEMLKLCQEALLAKGKPTFRNKPLLRVSAQGGIGRAEENDLLTHFYGMDSCGWGSPFLLVPEVTAVDTYTLQQLSNAEPNDYYLSYASPLGVPFNNFSKSTAEIQRKARIAAGRPGSPCFRKFLSFNTEFTVKPICTASRQYQNKKIKEIKATVADQETAEQMIAAVQEKDCLCEGLSVAALQKNNIANDNKLEAVTICPGPNLAYFSGVFSLSEMCGHIYGKKNILNQIERPHMFINELKLNIGFLRTSMQRNGQTAVPTLDFEKYSQNLLAGINYYRGVFAEIGAYMNHCKESFTTQLTQLEQEIASIKPLQLA
jgi:hypothetical protein